MNIIAVLITREKYLNIKEMFHILKLYKLSMQHNYFGLGE